MTTVTPTVTDTDTAPLVLRTATVHFKDGQPHVTPHLTVTPVRVGSGEIKAVTVGEGRGASHFPVTLDRYGKRELKRTNGVSTIVTQAALGATPSGRTLEQMDRDGCRIDRESAIVAIQLLPGTGTTGGSEILLCKLDNKGNTQRRPLPENRALAEGTVPVPGSTGRSSEVIVALREEHNEWLEITRSGKLHGMPQTVKVVFDGYSVRCSVIESTPPRRKTGGKKNRRR